MKTVTLFLLTVGLLIAGDGDSSAPTPRLPEDITLTSGRVLKRVEVIRWEKDRVVLKYAGGADPIPFSMIANASRTELEASRAAWLLADAKKRSAPAPSRNVSGQIYIVSRGRENYKLGDLNVYFVPKEEMDLFLLRNPGDPNWNDALVFEHFDRAPKGTIRARTDADGRYNAKLPIKGEFYALARDNRKVIYDTEWYVFMREIFTEDSVVNLSNGDLWQPKK